MEIDIETLKEIRAEKRISLQQIVNETERNGHAVSLSTVKRVLGKDSANSSFRHYTIMSIYEALLTCDGGWRSELEEKIFRLTNGGQASPEKAGSLDCGPTSLDKDVAVQTAVDKMVEAVNKMVEAVADLLSAVLTEALGTAMMQDAQQGSQKRQNSK